MAQRLFIRLALCVPALALGLSLSPGAAAADGGLGTVSTLGDPAHAALLNAGTVLTGLRPDGTVGLDPQTISLAADVPGDAIAGVQVAGVTVGEGSGAGAADTET